MVGGKFMQIDQDLAEDHYGEHEGKPFFEGLVEFITSGPVFAMVWEGQDAIRQVRRMMARPTPPSPRPVPSAATSALTWVATSSTARTTRTRARTSERSTCSSTRTNLSTGKSRRDLALRVAPGLGIRFSRFHFSPMPPLR